MAAASQPEVVLSAKAKKLDAPSKARYLDKLGLIEGNDPYLIPKKDWSSDSSRLHAITYPDIVTYMVFSISAYTLDEMKAYKSLEAYNQFVCGWVRDVCVNNTPYGEHMVITGRVSSIFHLHLIPNYIKLPSASTVQLALAS